MLYFIVRVLVNMVAIWLTLNLVPGVHMLPLSGNYDPTTPPQLVATLQFILPFIYYFAVALAFWFWNWLFWPLILLFTGRMVLWSFGVLLIVENALLFYWVAISGSATTTRVDHPVWLWMLVCGISMTFWLFVLEGITGLDSPLRSKAGHHRSYWRVLGLLTFGGRNFFAENLRIAQSLEIVMIYLRDLAFDASPLGSVRRFFQRIIYRSKQPLIEESAPETVRFMLQELGPTYVKLGQIVFSRVDNLPRDWREQMSRLQSSDAPFSFEIAAGILQRELGAPIEQLYAGIEQKPVAVDSTAQVHLAALAGGQKVAVKVQRPDIETTVRADLNVVRDLTVTLEKRLNWARDANIGAITSECADNILRELDYTTLAFNGRVLAKNMQMLPDVHVPTVYPNLSTSRVLTQEFIGGIKITDLAALDAAGMSRTQLATSFMCAVLRQVLYDGFFHGDPRHGNVLVNPVTCQIVFGDISMVAMLTSTQRTAMANLLLALSKADYRELARLLLGMTTHAKPVDEGAFAGDVDRLLTRYTALADRTMFLSGAMQALLDAMYKAGLRMDPQFMLAMKAMMQAEETVHTLDAALPLVDAAFAAARELLAAKDRPDGVVGTQADVASGIAGEDGPAGRGLTPAEIRQFKDALRNAFVRATLEQVVFFGLEVRLDDIVARGTFDKEVTDLVIWANDHNKVAALLEEARKENPGNGELREFASYMQALAASSFE